MRKRAPLTPNDPRHGTTAGFRAHAADGERPCRPCRDAKNAYDRANRRPQQDYTKSGYDPNDGLPAGRWMRDTWGVVRYVEIPAVPAVEDVRNRRCHECGADVGPRFRYCGPCGKERGRAVKREHMREVRAA